MNRHIQMRLRCTTAGVDGTVVLAPVSDIGGRENETFHAAETAPTAAVSFTITNGDTKGSFKAGDDYIVKITPAQT